MRQLAWCVLTFCALVVCQSDLQGADVTGLHGAWDLTVETEQGSRPSWVKFFAGPEGTVAEFVGSTGGKSRANAVRIDGSAAEWTVGDTTYQVQLADSKLVGTRTTGDEKVSLTGERVVRKTDVTGTWDVEVDLADRTMTRTLKLEQRGEKITGSYSGEGFSEVELTGAAIDGDRLTYAIDFELDDGQEFHITYDITVQGDRFHGTFDIEGIELEGTINATRKRKWGSPIDLFNGRDLSNWDFQRSGAANHWQVVDGVMVNQESGWNAFTQQRFKNYKLRADVKVPPRGNSGIYINGRYEVQVEDSYGKQASEGSMGAIYGRAVPTTNPSRPADEWQTFEITFVDYWVTVALNGTTVVDNVLLEGITGGALDSRESEPGPIMLQGDHGHIEYRNIVLTPLER